MKVTTWFTWVITLLYPVTTEFSRECIWEGFTWYLVPPPLSTLLFESIGVRTCSLGVGILHASYRKFNFNEFVANVMHDNGGYHLQDKSQASL